MSGDGWQALAEHVRKARRQLRQTQHEFAASIGVSTRIVGTLESGQPHRYDAVTIGHVEDALGWYGGSFDAVVEGRRPRVDVDPMFARIRDAWPRLDRQARAMLVAAVDNALRE